MTFARFKTLLAMRRVFLLALLLAISAVARSEEPTSNPVDIGEVRVEGKGEYESLEDVSAFTTVIKPTLYDERIKSAKEILSETAGIDVTSLGGEGQLSTVSIRGSSAEQVDVFVDGVRINSSLYGTVDFSTIPIESVERIEVIRGASSARFGTGAIGGVINIITKKSGKKRAIDLKLTGGSFETLYTSESWSEPRKRWGFLLSHSHHSTGGDFTFKSAQVTLSGQTIGSSRTFTRLHNRSISEDVLTKANFDITDTIHLAVSNDFFWTDRQVPGTEEQTTVLYPTIPLDADEEIFRNTSGVKIFLDRLFIDSLSFESGAAFLADHDRFTNPVPPIGDPIDVTNVGFSPEGYATFMHSAGWRHAGLSSTFRYQHRYDYSRNTSPDSGLAQMGRHGRNTNSVFLEEQLGLFGERFFLMPQGRLETASGRKTRFSWKAGSIGKPKDWLDIKANVGTSFRYPTFSELYFPDQGYLRGNPDLSDEQTLSWDAGFIIHPKHWSFEFSYFQNRIDNQIIFVPISALTIQPVNTFRVFTQGIEAGATINPIRQFYLHVNYTWLDAHYSVTNLELPGRPRHKGNVRLEGRFKVHRFFNELNPFGEIQVVGSFPVNVANTVKISGHTSLNLGTTVGFAKRFFATLQAKDITNVQIYDARGFPLPRRSYWVTVGAKI